MSGRSILSFALALSFVFLVACSSEQNPPPESGEDPRLHRRGEWVMITSPFPGYQCKQHRSVGIANAGFESTICVPLTKPACE